MMHRYSSSQEHVMGACSCGMFHSQSNSNMMLFSMPNQQSYEYVDESDMYSFTPSSSSVDCTLSLGTPSTRLTEDGEKRGRHERRSVSNYCWDLLQSKHSKQSQSKSSRGSHSSSSNGNSDDHLLARRCANCDTTSTPLWRNGPRGPKSLCNACGIRFKKEERRASAAAASTGATSGGVMDSPQMYNNSWYGHSQGQMPYFSPAMGNEYGYVDDADSENGISYLSWQLNVTDRPSLVHDFTR